MSYLLDELCIILNFLDINSINNFALCCKEYNSLSNGNTLWKHKFFEYVIDLKNIYFSNKENILKDKSDNWKDHFRNNLGKIKFLKARPIYDVTIIFGNEKTQMDRRIYDEYCKTFDVACSVCNLYFEKNPDKLHQVFKVIITKYQKNISIKKYKGELMYNGVNYGIVKWSLNDILYYNFFEEKFHVQHTFHITVNENCDIVLNWNEKKELDIEILDKDGNIPQFNYALANKLVELGNKYNNKSSILSNELQYFINKFNKFKKRNENQIITNDKFKMTENFYNSINGHTKRLEFSSNIQRIYTSKVKEIVKSWTLKN